MRITIHADGTTDGPAEVQFIREAVMDDGTARRFFLCIGCKEIIEAINGTDHVHECDAIDLVSNAISSTLA